MIAQLYLASLAAALLVAGSILVIAEIWHWRSSR